MTTEYTYLLFSLFFSRCLFIGFCLLLSLYISFFQEKKVRSMYKNVKPAWQALGSSGRKRERALERETREGARFFLCPLLPSACYAG